MPGAALRPFLLLVAALLFAYGWYRCLLNPFAAAQPDVAAAVGLGGWLAVASLVGTGRSLLRATLVYLGLAGAVYTLFYDYLMGQGPVLLGTRALTVLGACLLALVLGAVLPGKSKKTDE